MLMHECSFCGDTPGDRYVRPWKPPQYNYTPSYPSSKGGVARRGAWRVHIPAAAAVCLRSEVCSDNLSRSNYLQRTQLRKLSIADAIAARCVKQQWNNQRHSKFICFVITPFQR
ncbi:hypothetical protein KUCAC02_025441, partial [Chaenocephalus aceratus]